MKRTLGMSASMEPRLLKTAPKRKVMRVRNFGIPGLGRIAFTKDLGEAELFSKHWFQTNLSVIVRDPTGRVVQHENLGSGLVTNAGVLALAHDLTAPAPSGTSASLLANVKFHAWGLKNTAANEKDIKITEAAAPTNTEAEEGTQSVVASGTGEPKFKSVRTIKEGVGTQKIEEWAIYTQKKLSTTVGTGKFVSVTATSGKASGAVLTASSSTIKGETLKLAVATEATEIWGLITSNTTEEVTVDAWYKQSTGAVQSPTGTSVFTITPVMFDHRVFGVLTVEENNTVEFPWELTIKSGG